MQSIFVSISNCVFYYKKWKVKMNTSTSAIHVATSKKHTVKDSKSEELHLRLLSKWVKSNFTRNVSSKYYYTILTHRTLWCGACCWLVFKIAYLLRRYYYVCWNCFYFFCQKRSQKKLSSNKVLSCRIVTWLASRVKNVFLYLADIFWLQTNTIVTFWSKNLYVYIQNAFFFLEIFR